MNFLIIINKKEFSCYDKSLKKFQKLFKRAIFNANETSDINNLKTIFKNKFNSFIYLSIDTIYYKKYIAFGTLNKLFFIRIME